MTIKSMTFVAVSAAYLLCASIIHSAHATSLLLDEFVEATSDAVAAVAPRMPGSYPGARFLISGFSTPWGNWKFIRVENVSACEEEVCPTLVIHDTAELKVLILARKGIEVSVGSLNERFVICKLFSKGKSEVSFRYADDEKVLYVAQ